MIRSLADYINADEQLWILIQRWYREADALDRETGDNRHDLIRAGKQSQILDCAAAAEAIRKELHKWG